MRLSDQSIDSNIEKEIRKLLAQIIADIHEETEAEQLLSDLLTPAEQVAVAKRLGIAMSLIRGASYEEIKKRLKVSSATVAKVQESMDTPGMKLALSKAATDEWAEKWASKLSSAVNKLMGSKS